jgi:hypothetical protein
LVTRVEYERVVESLLNELSFIVAGLTQDDLHALPKFTQELRETRVVLDNTAIADAHLVGVSFGVVDEFVHAAWDTVMSEAYALYVDMSGGESHRHPKRRGNE